MVGDSTSMWFGRRRSCSGTGMVGDSIGRGSPELGSVDPASAPSWRHSSAGSPGRIRSGGLNAFGENCWNSASSWATVPSADIVSGGW